MVVLFFRNLSGNLFQANLYSVPANLSRQTLPGPFQDASRTFRQTSSRTTNADAGEGIGLKREIQKFDGKTINSPIRPLISRKQYELTEDIIKNNSKV